MDSFHADLDRRINQFTERLKPMQRRAHDEVGGNCFMIFNEDSPKDDDATRRREEAAAELVEIMSNVFNDLGTPATLVFENEEPIELPTEGWREDDSQKRFIQFSFERDWFCMDMPRQTLYRAEAEHILRDRRGFFFLKDRPEFTLHQESTEGYDPFRKVYVYDDERSAAEDTAFVFFSVWKFPVDWQFFVTAAAFGKDIRWEQGASLE